MATKINVSPCTLRHSLKPSALRISETRETAEKDAENVKVMLPDKSTG